MPNATDIAMVRMYIRLLREGPDTKQLATAEDLRDGVHCVVIRPDYDPEVETWNYLPGMRVRCRREQQCSHEVFIAYELYRDGY